MQQQKDHSHYRHPVYSSERQLSVYPLSIGRKYSRRKRKKKHERTVEDNDTLPTIQTLPCLHFSQYRQNRTRQCQKWKKETQIERYRHLFQYFLSIPKRFQPISAKQKVGRLIVWPPNPQMGALRRSFWDLFICSVNYFALYEAPIGGWGSKVQNTIPLSLPSKYHRKHPNVTLPQPILPISLPIFTPTFKFQKLLLYLKRLSEERTAQNDKLSMTKDK